MKEKQMKNSIIKGNMKKEKKGITLIALVITIIVLLILAGVTIAALTGDNGILTNATEAQSKQADATVVDAISLAWNEYQIEIQVSTEEVIKSEIKIASTTQVKIQGEKENYLASPTMSFLDFLKDDERGYINENGVINVEALTGGKLSKGNGTDGATDVYKIEEIDGTYTLKYCGKNNEETILWKVSVGGSESSTNTYPEATPEDKFYYSETEDGVTLTGFHHATYTKEEWMIYDNGGWYADVAGGGIIEFDDTTTEKPILPGGVLYILISDELRTDIVIPKTINNIEVVALQSNEGFLYHSTIRTITIPYSVKEISNDMFSDTKYLNTISFPEGKNPELEIPADKWGADDSVQIIGKDGETLAE